MKVNVREILRRTRGVIPVAGEGDDVARFVVEQNRIVDVLGDGPRAIGLREDMEAESHAA